MLYIKLRKIIVLALVAFVVSSILFATNSLAQAAAAAATTPNSTLFADLIAKGNEIFSGMRDIIFAVSGFGIIAIAVGGFFGNFNWKWLGAIIIGLMVVGMTSGIIQYMVGEKVISVEDSLKE